MFQVIFILVACSLTSPCSTKPRPHGFWVLSKIFSIWYGATVRGDVNKVTIGDHTSIGDRAVVHVAKIQGDFATHIGNHVTVGPCAIIHAATLGDGVVIGASAQVLDGALVEAGAVVAPGAVVTPGTVVSAGELWAGAPARKVRTLTELETNAMAATAKEQMLLAQMHAFENSKDYVQLAKDEEEMRDLEERSEDYWQPKNYKDMDDVLGQGRPGLIFNSTLSHPEEGLKLMKERALKEAKEKAATQQ
jgi:gamma-carbonic anhydrase